MLDSNVLAQNTSLPLWMSEAGINVTVLHIRQGKNVL